MQQPIHISGIGIVSAIGNDITAFAHALEQGQCGIGLMADLPDTLPMQVGAPIQNFAIADKVTEFALSDALKQRLKRATHRAPFPISLAVGSALEAWAMARLCEAPITPERLGLVVAGQNITRGYQFQLTEKFNQAPHYLSPKYALHFLDTDHVGTLSETFEIQGEGFTVGGASASGNVALIKAAQMLELGLVDACLVVGAIADLSPMEWQGFCAIGAMGGKHFGEQPSLACRPFDREHEGFIYGQASGAMLLETRESGERRGVPPLAHWLGGAMVLDASRLAHPNEIGEARAMHAALQQADLQPEAVVYLNTHGSSSPLGDKTEIQAIRAVFGEHFPDLWLNASKGLVGHTLYAAGVVEAIAAVIQMREGFIHPNLNLNDPIDAQARFAPGQAIKAPVANAMSNSFGFGGINTSIILAKGGNSHESRY